MRTDLHSGSARRGVALLVTLLFLALFAALAATVALSAAGGLFAARNRRESQQAAALAETGLQLVQRELGGLSVPGTGSAADLHEAVADHLRTVWASSSMVDAEGIASSAAAVDCPPLVLTRTDGRQGAVHLLIAAAGGAADDTTLMIRSTGEFGGACRTVFYNLTVQRGRTVLADYGIASKSPVQITGDPVITGLNDPAEASILSASYSTNQPIRLTGNSVVSGDVAVCNPDAEIVKRGHPAVGGAERIGAPEPEWPQVDPSIFRPYANNVYSGNGSGDLLLSNIRIPAGTNPNFSGNTVICGVVYVESPNRVTFSGNTVLVGTIVCEPPAVDSLRNNQVKFTGNLVTQGVECLPDIPAYHGLRDLTGSFLLAPGYSAQFSGNFSTVNGCMVASEFKFTGNAGGVVRGGVVNLRDSSFQIDGNARITIDRARAVENPAGLTVSHRLVCLSGSYSE